MKKLFVMWLLTVSSVVLAVEPIKIVVSTAPGGITDRVARAIQPHLNNNDVSFVVDYKIGAGGVIASNFLVEHDRPAVMVTSQSVIVNYLNGKLKYDLLKDYEMISCMVINPMAIVVKNDSAVKSYYDLVNTKGLLYGTSGPGSVQSVISNHLTKNGPTQTEVYYKGGADIVYALLSKTVDWTIDSIGLFEPLLRSGDLRLLAVTDNHNYKSVPTFKDLGIDPGFQNKVFLLANTRDGKINSYVRGVVKSNKVKDVIVDLGYTPCGEPDSTFIANEMKVIQRMQSK